MNITTKYARDIKPGETLLVKTWDGPIRVQTVQAVEQMDAAERVQYYFEMKNTGGWVVGADELLAVVKDNE